MSPVSQRSVLVVDDNQPGVISMGILLKRLDYSVLTALNTFDAIKAIANMHPAVVFMNIRMTGIAACLAHISKDARLKATPVVMMGEKPDTKIMEECLKKGAAAYIIKPINPTSIYRVIQKLTKKNQGRMCGSGLYSRLLLHIRISEKYPMQPCCQKMVFLYGRLSRFRLEQRLCFYGPAQ